MCMFTKRQVHTRMFIGALFMMYPSIVQWGNSGRVIWWSTRLWLEWVNYCHLKQHNVEWKDTYRKEYMCYHYLYKCQIQAKLICGGRIHDSGYPWEMIRDVEGVQGYVLGYRQSAVYGLFAGFIAVVTWWKFVKLYTFYKCTFRVCHILLLKAYLKILNSY